MQGLEGGMRLKCDAKAHKTVMGTQPSISSHIQTHSWYQELDYQDWGQTVTN